MLIRFATSCMESLALTPPEHPRNSHAPGCLWISQHPQTSLLKGLCHLPGPSSEFGKSKTGCSPQVEKWIFEGEKGERTGQECQNTSSAGPSATLGSALIVPCLCVCPPCPLPSCEGSEVSPCHPQSVIIPLITTSRYKPTKFPQ